MTLNAQEKPCHTSSGEHTNHHSDIHVPGFSLAPKMSCIEHAIAAEKWHHFERFIAVENDIAVSSQPLPTTCVEPSSFNMTETAAAEVQWVCAQLEIQVLTPLMDELISVTHPLTG